MAAATTRRGLFGMAAAGAAAMAVPGAARAELKPYLSLWGGQPNGPRRVAIHNLHTGEKLDTVYFENGRYLPDALQAVNKLLRDYRTGDVYPMRPQLIDLLHALSGQLEASRPYEIISGYRSPATNAMLHEQSSGVASHSLHMQGMATDIRVPGVALGSVHRAALSLSRGGVGYYPSSDFVHVDVGPVRSWG